MISDQREMQLRTGLHNNLNKDHYEPAYLFSITLIGILLRLYRLGSHSFWLDEADSVKIVRVILGIDPSGNWSLQLSRPFYYLLLTPFYLLSQSEWSLRLVSAIAGILAILILYIFGSRVWNKRIGLLAALLLAVSPFHIYYSQELRSYTWVMLLSILGFYFSCRALEGNRNRDYFGMIAAFLTGIYTHIYTLFPLVIVNLHYLFECKKHRSCFRKLVFSNLLILILGAPIFYLSLYFSTHLDIRLSDFPSGFRSLIATFYLFTMGRVFFPAGANLLIIVPQLALFATGFALGLFRLWKARNDQPGASMYSFVLASLVIYLSIWLISVMGFPLFDEARVNYLIFLLPIFLRIVSIGWDSVSTKLLT